MKRLRHPRGALVAAFATSALIVAACSGGSSDQEGETAAQPEDAGPGTAEQLRLGILSEEGNLTPHSYQTGFPGLNMTMLAYDTVLQVDAEGIPQPWLAQDVDLSEDGLVYTITLEEDLEWHDGEPLTADDIVFTVEYYREYGPGRFTTAVSTIEEATAEDEQTVALTLSRTNPSFELRTLADVPILPEHIWSEIDDPDTAPFDEATRVGSGPYQVVDSQPGRSYTLEANAEYFRGTPKVDRLVFVWFADDAGANAALRSGEVDTLVRVTPPEQIDSLQTQGLSVLQAPEYATTFLAYNTERAPFDDIEFRRGLAAAVNVDLLVEDVYLGAAVAGSPGWIHPDSPFSAGDAEPLYDPEAAGALLDAAGYLDDDGDGVREIDGQAIDLELLVYGNNALRLRVAELVATQLGEVGIGVTVSAVETSTLDDAVWPGFDVAQGRDYEMAIFGWSAPTQADIGQFAALVSSDHEIGNLNVTGFSDPEVDEVAVTLQSALDEDERMAAVQDMEELFVQHLPLLPLLYPNGAYAYQADTFDDWVSIVGQGPMTKLSFIPDDGQP